VRISVYDDCKYCGLDCVNLDVPARHWVCRLFSLPLIEWKGKARRCESCIRAFGADGQGEPSALAVTQEIALAKKKISAAHKRRPK